MNTPYYSFTIITPAYNSEKYIDKAIKSIINMKYDLTKVDHYIIDDGSTDSTEEIVKKYLASNPHIKYIKKENGNWGSVINYAKHNSLLNKDYVIILDSDDYLLPSALNTINNKCKNADMFIGSSYLWNGKRFFMPCNPFLYLFRREVGGIKKVYTPILMPIGIAVKKEIFIDLPDLIEKRPHEDAYLFFNAFHRSTRIRYCKKHTGYYWKWRADNTMASIVSNDAKIKEVIEKMKYYALQEQPIQGVHFLFGYRVILKYMKQNNIKIYSKTKPSFKWYPWYIRWFMFFWYCISIKEIFVFTS